MYYPDFRGCRVKLNRAEEQRKTLEHYIFSFQRRDRNRAIVRANFDSASGYHILSLQSVPNLSQFLERVSVRVGEIIHDQRSCLDHLVWQLACYHTGGNPSAPRRIQFPIDDDPAVFQRRLTYGKPQGWLGEVLPAHQAVIEGTQPYHGLNDLRSHQLVGAYIHELAILRDLSDLDKHRILTELAVAGEGFALKYQIIEIDPTYAREQPRSFDRGAEVMRARFAGQEKVEPNVEMVGSVGASVFLKVGGYVHVETKRISLYLAQLLSEFEQLSYP